MGLEHITRWRPLATQVAPEYGLDAELLLGVVAQESSGNPYAIRVERGFWRRYGQGVIRNVLGNRYAGDDRWLQYPDLASASYGLCQIMWPVAIERGARLRYPTELCDPQTNLTVACQHLAYLRSHVGGSERGMLLRYNGGGDPHYPDRVAAWRRRLMEA